jgi:MFS family permease
LFGDDADILDDRDFRLLMLASLMTPLGTALVSPMLDTLTGVYGVDTARIGLMVSALTAPGIVAIPVAGTLADRYGRKPLLVGSLLVFGVAGGTLTMTTEFRFVLTLRVVQGLGFAGLVPTLITSLGDIYEGTAEATAQGLRIATVGTSLVTVPAIAGALVVLDWRWPLYMYAAAVPIAVVLALYFREPADLGTDDVPRVSDGGDRTTTADDAEPTTGDDGTEDPSQWRALFELATHRSIALLLLARALPTFVWFGFFTYNSILVVRLLDGTPGEAGLLVAVASVAFTTSSSQTGRLTDRLGGRFEPLVGGHLAMLVGFALLAVAPSLLVAGVGVVAGGVGFGLTISLYRSLVSTIAPERSRGGLVSAGESLGRLAATAAPVVMGAAVAAATPLVGFDRAIRATVLATAVLLSLAGLACLVAARQGGSLAAAGPASAD